MKKLIAVVLLIDVALIVAVVGWRLHPPQQRRPEPRRAASHLSERVLQQNEDAPWWLRDANAARERYSEYALAVGVGEAATRTLARDQAVLKAQKILLGNEVDSATATGFLTLEEYAASRNDRWTVYVLEGREK